MKINIEIDVSPEEMRRFLGLPDVGGIQQQMIERFTDSLQNSQEQQQEFVRNLFANGLAPWQAMLGAMFTDDRSTGRGASSSASSSGRRSARKESDD